MINFYVLIAILFLGFECLGMKNNSRKRPLSACLQTENFPENFNVIQPFELFPVDDLEKDHICSPQLLEKITLTGLDEQKAKKLKNNRLSDFNLSDEQIQEILTTLNPLLPLAIRLRQLSYKVQLQGANIKDAEKIKKRARNLI